MLQNSLSLKKRKEMENGIKRFLKNENRMEKQKWVKEVKIINLSGIPFF